MNRLKATNSVAFASRDIAPVSGTPQYATDGTPGVAPATQWPAYAFNMVQDELMAFLTAAGITPDDTNWSQVLASARVLFGFNQAQLLTSSGTFTVPAGVYNLRSVELWGPGGAGARGIGGNVGAGGGGGAYGFNRNIAVVPGAGLVYLIGAGAPAQTVDGASAAGGTTQITIGGVTYTAGGGQGGNNSGTPFTPGGTATNNFWNISGGQGRLISGTKGGDGGLSPRGGGGGSGGLGLGQTGDFPGGGGAGSPAGVNSGGGGNGAILLTW